MNLRHTEYNARFLDHARQNNGAANHASEYGVKIAGTDVSPDAPSWRVIGVHHLLPEENRGDHHVYFDVLDEQGNRVKNNNLAVHWTWQGRQANQVAKPAKLEKPDSEPVTNVPISPGAVLEVWLEGDGIPSDRVSGLRADHDDEPGPGNNKWNTKGHHSFYVVFQRGQGHSNNGTGDQPGNTSNNQNNGQKPVKEPNGQPTPQPNPIPNSRLAQLVPEYIFGLHEHAGGGEQLLLQAGKTGWVLELASVGLDGGGDNADFQALANQGLSVAVRVHNGYEPNGALPKPEHYEQFARACATYVSRSRGCHIWVIGNEPNHAAERPHGEFIFPKQYGDAYTRCRRAIRHVPSHEQDLVLVAGPAPWNEQTKYAGNESGDWVKYFADQIDAIPPGECDGFAIHTYTHNHDPSTIRSDHFHGAPGYQHLRNEFRTYQDFMNAIPARCRHLPVLITETDPTTPGQGWGAGHNNGWVREAYREIADWNSNPDNQPIQGMMLYRWPDPVHHGQKEWSIANRPGVIEDFKAALQAGPAADFRVRLPKLTKVSMPTPSTKRTIGRIPNIFSNQSLINACFGAAQSLGIIGDDLMSKGGLDVHQLAANQVVRQMRYGGPRVADLPNLGDQERSLIEINLIKELRATAKWRGQVQAEDGLNLRAEENKGADVLILLPDGTNLDVLDDQNEWLCVAADAETAGFVHKQFVRNLDASQPTQGKITPTGPTAHQFFRTDPTIQDVPMAPDAVDQIQLSPHAQGGAKRLAHIWNSYGGLITVLAERLAIDPTVAVAVFNVESGGAAFFSHNQPIIRFENHIFQREWGHQQPDVFSRHFALNHSVPSDGRSHGWRGNANETFQFFHGNQSLEWQVFSFAANLQGGDTPAKRSISMGLSQIMGFNHKRIGYATVQEMFNAFSADERSHVLGFFDYVRADPKLVQALRNRDYFNFAKGYNGTGNAPTYEKLIKASLAAFEQLTEVSFNLGEGVLLDDELDNEIAFIPIPQQPEVFAGSEISLDEEHAQIAQPAQGAAESVAPSHLPAPESPRSAVDPEVHEAWIDYVKQGLENNNILFSRILRAFILPYYLTVAMYVLLFLVGIGLFVMAVMLGLQDGKEIFGLIFAGLGVATFIGYFLSRPLRALEENLQLITWLGIAYNTYWTRLLYMNDQKTVHEDLKDASDDAAAEIQRIIDKSKELSRRRPDVKGVGEE
ncbi:MAG: N-acetylmuramidase domain-containing protein [Chloroflexota bacterium]